MNPKKITYVLLLLFSSLSINFCQRIRTTTSRTPAPSRKKDAVTIANEKCQQYSSHRFSYKTLPPQIIGDTPITYRTLDCVPVKELIVGGTKALLKEYPHMALIGFGDASNIEWACGGSLISEQFVLSAAHCSTTPLGEAKYVLLGDLDISTSNDKSQPKTFRIAQRYEHPGYKPPDNYNDIALFRLNATVQFSPYIRPTCLYTSLNIPASEKAVSATGWGLTGSVEQKSDYLLKATIYYVEEEKCRENYNQENTNSGFSRGFDSKSAICAGDLSASAKDTCQGDSGGPIQTLTNVTCMWAQVGITSVGPGICGNSEVPAVYTRVAYYLSWIQGIVWP